MIKKREHSPSLLTLVSEQSRVEKWENDAENLCMVFSFCIYKY